jgi:four helix bundle protein
MATSESSGGERGKGAELRARVFEFACAVVDLHRRIYSSRAYLRHPSRQAMSAATSIGANLEEADGAQSKADLISKCCISLKEAREARYWLRILERQLGPNEPLIAELIGGSTEFVAILTTIIRKSRISSDTIRDENEDSFFNFADTE